MTELKKLVRRESVAAGLRSKRAIKKVTQREAAEEIGVTQTSLSSYENNGGISIEDAWAAADYYKCSLDELAGRTWPPKKEVV